MKTVMIHQIEDWMLNVDLSGFDEITFDDGYISQYNYLDHFSQFNKPMKFFVITSKIGTEGYMSWDQVNELHGRANTAIGGHSHTHPDLRNTYVHLQYISAKEECKNMLSAFAERDITINSFCYPYNFEALGYKHILQDSGIRYFYGSERTPIEDLK